MQNLAAAPDYSELRRRMVDCQVRTFGVTDERVIAALMSIPREIFVDPASETIAYSDVPLKVASGTVERPLIATMVLARLLQFAEISPSDSVLVVGAGSGYAAAVAARLAATTVALESEAGFSDRMRAAADRLNLSGLRCTVGSLEAGVPDHEPFDVILIPAAVEQGLEQLLGQLADGGRLVTVQRSAGQTGLAMKAVRFDKRGSDIGSRVLFDAPALVLGEFARKPAFVF